MQARKRSIFERIVSGALALALACSGLMSNVSAAAAASPTPPETSVSTPASQPTSPTIVRELTEKRTESSKELLLSDGTIRAQYFADPIYYRDPATKSLKPIDTTLRETSAEGKPVSVNKANSFRLELPEGLSDDLVSIEVTGAKLSIQPEFGRRAGAAAIGDLDSPACPVSATERAYPKAFANARLEYESRPDGVKETIVLDTPSNQNVFGFRLQVQGLVPRVEFDRTITFLSNETGEPALTIPAPFMTDSSGSTIGGDYSDVVHYELSGAGPVYHLDVVADSTWLGSPERVYPVRIDPTITTSAQTQTGGNDTYISSAYQPTNYISHNLLWVDAHDPAADWTEYVYCQPHGALITGMASKKALGQYVVASRLKLPLTSQYIAKGGNVIGNMCTTSTALSLPSMTWDTYQLGAGSTVGGMSTPYVDCSSSGTKVFDVSNMVAHWQQLALPQNKCTVKLQGTAGTHVGFNSADNTGSKPVWEIDYAVPSHSAAAQKSVYDLSGSDVVTLTATVGTAELADLQQLSVRVNGAEAGSRARGELRWYATRPSDSTLTTEACIGGGYVASVTTDTAYTEPILSASQATTVSGSNGATTTVTFAFRVKDAWGDVQANSLDTKITLSHDGSNYTSPWQSGSSEFNVVPAPVPDDATISAQGLEWFAESYGNPALSPNDDKRKGRGTVDLEWPAVEQAAGYRIWAHDGNAWRQVGSTDSSATTHWKSEGAGLFPIDTAIAGLPASSTVDGFRGTSPSLASCIASPAAGVKSAAPIVVSDGVYLYTRGSVEATAWARVGSGLKSTQAGVASGTVGAANLKAAKSAFYLDGHLYSGSTATTNTDVLQGVWVNASSGVTTSTELKFNASLLGASTGTDAALNSNDVLVASDGANIYSVSETLGGGFNGWRVRKYERNGTQPEMLLVSDEEVAIPSYKTASVIAQPGFLTFVESSTATTARVTRVRTSDWSLVGRWSLGLANPGSGAWDAANDSIWIGSTTTGRIWRTTAAGVELRDNPSGLYAKTAGTVRDGRADYEFAVTAFNSGGDSPMSTALPVQLPSRTDGKNDDPRHVGVSVGSAQGNAIGAVLDQGLLTLDASDLGVSSWGPAASVSRHYQSDVTTAGLFARGWRFNFEQTIEADPASQTAIYVDEVGERHSFVATDSVYYAPNGYPATLTSDTANYYLTFLDRSTLNFDLGGRLLSETDRNGSKVDYVWSGDKLATIQAANGQSIELSYGGVLNEAKLASVSYQTAQGKRTVIYDAAFGVVTYLPDDPDESYSTSYAYYQDALSTITVAAQDVEPASWQIGYDSGKISAVGYPQTTQDPVSDTLIDYSGSTATVKSSANVSGTTETVEQTYEWNSTGTLKSKSDPVVSGGTKRWWTYVYGAGNKAIAETSPAGALVHRTIDTSGNVVFEWDEEGHMTSRFYDEYSQPVRLVDERGCTTYNTFDEQGNLTEFARQLNATEFERALRSYSGSGAVEIERALISEQGTQSKWAQTAYEYGSLSGQPTKSTASAGTMVREPFAPTYSDWTTGTISLSSTETVDAIVTRRTYDEFGNVTGEWDAAGIQQLVDPVYGISGRLEESSDVEGVKTITTYDLLGRVTASHLETTTAEHGKLVAESGSTEYDALGRAVAESALTSQGVVNISVTHRFDPAGQEERTIDSIEGTTTTWYDQRGDVVAVWAPGAAVTSETAAARAVYDLDGRTTAEYEPGKSVSAITNYSPNGLVTKVTEPDGSWVGYKYDQGGNLTERYTISETSSNVSETTNYDIGGRPIETVSTEGMHTRTYYDLAGRMTRAATTSGTVESTATTMAYNELGWELSSKDSEGIVKQTAYDVLGNVTRATTLDASGTVTENTTNNYDSKKRLKSCDTIEGTSTVNVAYAYDAFGRTTEEKHTRANPADPQNPLVSRWVKTTYDEFGRELTVADQKSGIAHSYDYAIGAKKKSTDTAAYEAVNLRTMSDASGRETSQEATFTLSGSSVTASRAVSWDEVRNLPKSVSVGVSGVALTSTYQFDIGDKLTSITGGPWKSGGVYATYNTTGTASKTKDVVSLPFGTASQISTTTRGFGYSNAGRLTTVTVTGTGAKNIYYKWNASGSGDLEKVTDGATVTDLAYTAGRLLSTKRASVTTTYTFDAAGRRSREASAGGSVQYSWVGDDVLSAWATKSSAGTTLTSAAYTYDGEGQRIAATVVAPSPWSTTTTSTAYTYGWEGTSLCWVRASSAGAEARLTYLFDENERVYAASYESTRSGVSTSTVFRVMSTDHGDIVGLANGAGDVFAKYSYGPFGEMDSTVTTAVAGVSAPLATEIAAANSLRYAGYQFDTWSGSYYLQARYYDPTTKQFISRDPAEADGEESTYQYCGGDPIGLVDPTGMWGFSFGGVFKAVRRTFSRARASVNRAVSRVKTVARVAFKSVSRSVKAKVRKVRRWASAKKARVSHYYHRASKRFAKAVKHRRSRRAKSKSALRSTKVASADPVRVNDTGESAAWASQTGALHQSPGYTPELSSTERNMIAGATLFIGAAAASFVVGDVVLAGILPAGKKALEEAACFPAGTFVMAAAGLVPIERLREGDTILSRDERTGAQSLKPVLRTMVHQVTELIHVRVATDTITSTPNHPFRVAGRGWVAAGDLAAGDTLYLADGGRADIVSVTREKLATPVDVYNVEVADFHTYFVAGAGVWVHNCGGGNPLQGASYTPKVLGQMANSADLNHSFPSAVDGLARASDAVVKTGGDGALYTHVNIPGAINGVSGSYHYIIDGSGMINHRLFESW